uniref:Synaptopodin 2-like protein n=1 Tax=Callorhinchus milii TaxID=7868 RepID=A0A4W3GXM7_CALMI
MGAGEEVLMTLGGGAPWGFRLQGGSDQQKPLQVAKVRKRSKAGRAGLCENDVLLSINGKSCFSISHADAMVSWSPEAESSLRGASPSARSPSPSKAPPRAPLPSAVERREIEIRRTAASPRESVLKSPDSITEANRQRLHVESYTSPPDSEAYYGETDSDADYITSEKQRRQKKKSPISSPRQSVKTSRVGSADEASEQSEYDSAPEHLHHSRPEPRGAFRNGKLHRSESVQEKQVKEARTKCKTIASLLTSAPNPHSKGVLMFKKRRQRAKKYTLVSYGSVDEDRNNLDEDGEILPTSESEFDEEAFSDAKSLTNQSTGSDWDSSYLDIEKPKSEPQGLMETNSKGVLLFEHQRQRAGEHTSKEGPAQMQQSVQQIKPKSTAEVMNSAIATSQLGLAEKPLDPKKRMTLYSPSEIVPYSPPPSTTPYSPPPSMTPYSPPPSTIPYSPPPSTIPYSPPPSMTPYSPPPSTTASSIGSPSSVAWSASQQSENLVTREQRISIPAARTGILQEARKRSTRKPMFTVTELPKPSPNPELLSLVQNLDVKPKPDHLGAGFESGPEEDFLSLGAEASNFMQSQARKQKTPPPVAPKPHVKPYIVGYGSPLSNGNVTSGIAQLKGKGAELFAKRQSRMDKFVVESVPTHPSHPRVPSPTPSLPSTWKYSPNIRAPPPIGYNPMHSPSYPLAACRSQAATSSAKMDKKGKLGVNQKVGIKAIDFMRHQPYQLNPAMFNFDSAKLGTQSLPRNLPSTQPGKQNNMSFISTKHVPVKTTRAYEIKRFSTPVPTMTPTIIAPRSATTLAEPVAPRVMPRPRFVVAKTGAHSHTWRPGV